MTVSGSKKKTALIMGVSGQDGTYLSKLLLEKGYAVFGTSRDAETTPLNNLKTVGLTDKFEILSCVPTDFRNVVQVVSQVQPGEIYNLSGQSSVGLSFTQPASTLEGITIGTLNILEAIRILDSGIRFYNAASSESFGETGEEGAVEATPFRPRSPYGVAKAAAFWEVANYREAYGLHVCSGILFNHESPLRHPRFVTRKVTKAACAIAAGDQSVLRLGNLDIERDWGWAPEFVDAMWRILQQKTPDDFVIATGKSYTLAHFVAAVFESFGLDWEKHVEIDEAILRPSDISCSRANPKRAKRLLGWEAKTDMIGVAAKMAAAEKRLQENER